MEFDFDTVIDTPTEFKEPPLVIDDPQPGLLNIEPAPQTDQPLPQPPGDPVKARDVGFSAEIAVSTLDSLQYVVFFMMHKRKLRNLYFDNTEDYKMATELARKTATEIESLGENVEKAKLLLSHYKLYLAKLESRTGNLPFTPEEESMMKKPLEKMMEKNPNLEIPPGIALLLAGLVIATPRIVDLTQDN